MFVFLKLFHGRTDPDEKMEDWGSDGAEIGPLEYVHTTYWGHIKFQFYVPEDAREWGFEDPDEGGYGDLWVQDGLIFYNGVYYGDWSVIPAQIPAQS